MGLEVAISEEPISAEPIKEKLKNLEQYVPGEQDVLYKVAAYIATRLESKLVPKDFHLGVEFALYDFKTGIDGILGLKTRRMFGEYSPSTYRYLREKVPEIAKAVCPEGFAESVIELHDQINEVMIKSHAEKIESHN